MAGVHQSRSRQFPSVGTAELLRLGGLGKLGDSLRRPRGLRRLPARHGPDLDPDPRQTGESDAEHGFGDCLCHGSLGDSPAAEGEVRPYGQAVAADPHPGVTDAGDLRYGRPDRAPERRAPDPGPRVRIGSGQGEQPPVASRGRGPRARPVRQAAGGR